MQQLLIFRFLLAMIFSVIISSGFCQLPVNGNSEARILKIYTQNLKDIPTRKFSAITLARIKTALVENQAKPGKQHTFKIDINCFDSSFRKQYHADKVAQYASFVMPAKNGDILLSGAATTAAYGFQRFFGYLIRMDKDGNIKWMKEYFNDKENWFDLYRLYETDNNEIIGVGDVVYKGSSKVDSNFCTAVIKLTEDGDVVWSTGFNSKLEKGMADCMGQSSVSINSVSPGLQGDFILNGTTFGCPSPQYNTTLLIDKDGNIKWDANYTSSVTFHQGIGSVLYNGNVLTVSKRDNIFSGGDNTINLFFQVFDYNTGKSIGTKGFKADYPYPDFYYKGFGGWSAQMIPGNNGHFYVYGNMENAYAPDGIHNDMFGVVEFDANLNYFNGYTVATDQIDKNGQTGYYNSEIQVHSSGFVTLSWLQSIASEEKHLFLATIKSGQFIKSQEAPYYNDMYGDSKLGTMDDGSLIYFSVYQQQADPYYKHWMVLKKNYPSDTSNNECIGVDTSFAWFGDLKYVEYPSFYIDDSAFNKLYLVHTDFSLLKDSLIAEDACKSVSACDTIKIHGKLNYCGSNPQAIFTAYKNEACGANVFWSFDTAAVSNISYPNDTTVTLQFNKNWSGKIYAETAVGACSMPAIDSVPVNVQVSGNVLNLGKDTILCKSDSLKLNPGSYKSYKWQDGSKDSIYVVTLPGSYSVMVTDFCGNSYSDAIVISSATIPGLSIGNDTTGCIGDTVVLNASPGFKNYSWFPSTLINSNGQYASVIINQDELIYMNATTTDGCMASDSISIMVKSANIVNLGNDTALCKQDSIVLRAGQFAKYLWSTGDITPAIAVKNKGVYSVTATDFNGCSTSDTMQINQVFNLPMPNLGEDRNICAGIDVTLDAGKYASYLWQDGSSSEFLKVLQPGFYRVSVTDNNTCKGADTVFIKNILPVPSDFLALTDSLCSYDELNLTSTGIYSSYLWSTGSRQPSITVDKPGKYSLIVTDAGGCSGADTTNVVEKDCMHGVYIPSAFTPNGDGKNDVFRAMVFGKPDYFNLSIYNRFGQLVFTTANPSSGWNGLVNAQPQNTGTYVWVCSYKMEGSTTVTEKRYSFTDALVGGS